MWVDVVIAGLHHLSAASPKTRRATLLVVAGRGQSPLPSLADSAHSFIVASLSPGVVAAVKAGRTAKQEGKSLSS